MHSNHHFLHNLRNNHLILSLLLNFLYILTIFAYKILFKLNTQCHSLNIVIFKNRFSCLAKFKSELSIIVIKSPSASGDNHDEYYLEWAVPSSQYLMVTSSVLFSFPLYTLCNMRSSSSYVISSLWMGTRLVSSPRRALMINFPLKSIGRKEKVPSF